MTRRAAKLMTVYLLLGLGSTLGTAVWLWHTEYPPRWSRGRYGWPELRFGYDTLDARRIICIGAFGSAALLLQRGPVVRTAEVGGWPSLPTDHGVPDWVMDHAERTPIGYRGYAMMYGLPWRSLAAPASLDESAIYPDAPRPPPTKVLWPGLLFDNLFYALLFASFHQAAAWGRRTQRRRRGLCLICGYDLRADYSQGCSECGWKRT